MLALPPPAAPQQTVATISRSESRLIGEAVRGRWPMSPETRLRVVQTLRAIVENPDRFEARVVINAGKALMSADKINIEEEARAVRGPEVTAGPTRDRVSFESMTDEDLDRYLEQKAD